MGTGFFSKIFGKKLDLESIKAEIRRIEQELRDDFNADAFRNGDWFLENFRKFVERYYDREHLRDLEREHPELTEPEIINRLVDDTVRKCTMAGGAAGAAVSAATFAGFFSGGIGFTVGLGMGFAEMIYISNQQLQLVFDIASLNGITLSFDEPEEMVYIFATAIGAKQLDRHSTPDRQELQVLGGAVIRYQSTKYAIRQIGIFLVKQLATKYAIPVVNIGIGALLNRTFTAKMAHVARERFERMRKMKEALFELQPKLGTDTKSALTAALIYYQSDGILTLEEIYLLREYARSIGASELWAKLWNQTQETEEVSEFLERFRNPVESVRREVLLQAIHIASRAKMIQSEQENQFLAKLIAL